MCVYSQTGLVFPLKWMDNKPYRLQDKALLPQTTRPVCNRFQNLCNNLTGPPFNRKGQNVEGRPAKDFRGQSYKTFYTLGQIYKRVLKHVNNAKKLKKIFSKSRRNKKKVLCKKICKTGGTIGTFQIASGNVKIIKQKNVVFFNQQTPICMLFGNHLFAC